MSALSGVPQPRSRRLWLTPLRRLPVLLVLLFLLANLAFRALVLHGSGGGGTLVASGVVLGAVLLLGRSTPLAPALSLFGASFFLYGFHSYRLQNQAFEYVVTALALVLLIRGARAPGPAPPTSYHWVLGGWILYAGLALFSLLLIPPTVLSHRVFLEGRGLFAALLGAFPSDPLYPIAAVNRLILLVSFAAVLSRQHEARALFRALFRGIAGAAVLAVVLGLLDFFGVLSLSRYNLSRLFFGAGYDRLQSTFGNPAWFACFVSCALPFVLLEFWEGGQRARLLLGIFFPLCATSLFFAAARAAWLAAAMLLLALPLIVAAARRWAVPLPPLGRGGWLALGSTVATAVLLAMSVYVGSAEATAPSGRREEVAREMRIRGLGMSSPRSVAHAYALELARQRPVFGLGYETFNLHLRAQLAVAGSGVARIVNPGAAIDPGDTVFDDAHNTYLQILAGTGGVGLLIWFTIGAVALVFVGREVRGDGTAVAVCVLLGMLVFHLYGLFQGMQYIPVTWFLFFLTTGYAMTVAPRTLPVGLGRALRGSFMLLGALVVLSPLDYGANRGFRDIKARLGQSAYLPGELAEFEGFYRPESWPQGEFRWMAGRGIVNVTRPEPFHLLIACEHPDLDREPVVLSFRFNGDPVGEVVFRRRGLVEKRFDFREPGTLQLTASRTWSPGAEAADRRRLGVAISAIRWE